VTFAGGLSMAADGLGLLQGLRGSRPVWAVGSGHAVTRPYRGWPWRVGRVA